MSFQPAVRLVDSHCHLNFDDFDQDRLQVIQRAHSNGIVKILIPAVDIPTSHTAIQYAHEYPDVYAAVGVHPNSGLTWSGEIHEQVRQLAADYKVVAIGEIGLDFYRHYTPKVVQRTVFTQQLELAAELGLPVIIHNRDSSIDMVDVLQDWCRGLKDSGSKLAGHPGVLHSFSGDAAMADTVVGLNFKIGIDGPITYKNSLQLQSVVKFVPLESLLLETDAPFLTPHPYRGKRNEPANVRIVAEKIAELKSCPIEVVASATTQAAEMMFDWSEIH